MQLRYEEALRCSRKVPASPERRIDSIPEPPPTNAPRANPALLKTADPKAADRSDALVPQTNEDTPTLWQPVSPSIDCSPPLAASDNTAVDDGAYDALPDAAQVESGSSGADALRQADA